MQSLMNRAADAMVNATVAGVVMPVTIVTDEVLMGALDVIIRLRQLEHKLGK